MTIDEMKVATTLPSVALSSYLKLPRRKGDLICFFEGVKDPYYYQGRIESITGKQLQGVVCGNKEAVLQIYAKQKSLPIMKADAKSKCVFAFFVDRDYDDLINNPDICETRGYSIENYYTNPEAFSNLIRDYLGICENSEDYKLLMAFYDNCFNQFHGVVNTFNAFYRVVRKKKLPIIGKHLGEHFPKELANIEVGKCTSNYNLIELNKRYGVSISATDLKTSLSFLSHEDLFYVFRGKYEMEFYFKLLQYIQSKWKSLVSKSISLTLNMDKIMSDYSQYAVFPSELHSYIMSHYQKATKM